MPPPTAEETAEFKRLDTIVQNGVKGYIEAGVALIEIHAKSLWRAGEFNSWEHYCNSVAGISKAHAHRLMQASECVIELDRDSELERKPKNESQVRPLLRIDDLGDRRAVWEAACYWSEDKECELTAKIVTMMVDAFEENEYGEVKSKPSPQVKKRAETFAKLKTAIIEKISWEEAKQHLDELEKLM